MNVIGMIDPLTNIFGGFMMIKQKKNEGIDFINSTLKQHRNELKDLHIKKIGIFGSYARGDYNKNSDIDFLVEFEEGYLEYFRLQDILYRIFYPKIIGLFNEYLLKKICIYNNAMQDLVWCDFL